MPPVAHEWPIFLALFLFVLALVRAFFSIDSASLEGFRGRKASLLSSLMSRLVVINASLPIPQYRKKLEKMLVDSGQNSVTFAEFMAQQEAYAVAVPAGLYLIDVLTDPMMLAGVGILAFFVPYIRLNGKITKNKKMIVSDLPFLIDLLALSVEAGSGFDQAIKNIIEHFPERPLKYELQLMAKNLQAGSSSAEALGQMRERLDILEVSGFCSALIQAGQMGTGLAVTLREQSAYIKKKRYEQRREQAKKAATLMIIPLLLFVFPSMFLVILGPVAIKMYYIMFPEGGG